MSGICAGHWSAGKMAPLSGQKYLDEIDELQKKLPENATTKIRKTQEGGTVPTPLGAETLKQIINRKTINWNKIRRHMKMHKKIQKKKHQAFRRSKNEGQKLES